MNKEEIHHKLFKSKVFCMAPWVHLHALSDGNVYPCCMADYKHSFGNMREETMAEVWNNEQYRELRRNMLNDKPSTSCKHCYELDAAGTTSLRQNLNRTQGKYVFDTNRTHEDGTHPEFKLRYWNLRFSNLCNFSCRSCSPLFSSKWYKDWVDMYGTKPVENGKELNVIEYTGRNKTDMLEQMEEHIRYMDHVYFSGGEPLIMEEHYAILERLIEVGRTDIELRYNTNFSELEYKGKSVLDLWKKFSNVEVGASLDASYERAELMRKGTDWAKIMNNRERVMDETPHVKFYITATVGATNIFHLPDFHQEWCNLGYIEPQDFQINHIQSPEWQRSDILPMWFKLNVANKIERHMKWIEGDYGYSSLINMMMAEDRQDRIPEFLQKTAALDKARSEDFFVTFPELECLKTY